MNKSVKIICIVAVALIAIGGILFYMKTIVSPPQDLAFNNQFENALNQRINGLKNTDQSNLESEFASLTDLTHRFKIESSIDDKTFDAKYIDIIGVYAPKFSNYCFSQFQKSVWDDKEHKWMEGRINQLRGLTVDDGSKKIMDQYKETDGQFTIILRTIDKYRQAKALAGRTSYQGLSDAQSKINQAKEFKNDDYLKNNASLIKSLNNLASNIESSHYNSLRAKVNNLANYYSYTAESYDKMSDNVVAALKEYEDRARSVYGTARSLNDLKNEASRYYNQAVEYFND